MVDGNVRLNRILCAVTFSPLSGRVVAWAASLAGRCGGEVRLFHALPGCGHCTTAEPEADSERVLTKLFTLAREIPGRPRISAAVTQGEAAAEIVCHARIAPADLIAIGMHAHDGSVSPLVSQVAVAAPCPVLVVDETTSPVRGATLDRIVVAVNVLPASRAAADYACALARTLGAQVTVVHVLPESRDVPGRRDANAGEARQLDEHHARRLLQIAIDGESGSSRGRSELVTSDGACAEIVRAASAHDADVVVMGIDASQHSQPALGAAAACVMQAACRTVLLVPERSRLGREDGGHRPR